MCEKALETVRPARGRTVTSQGSAIFICGLDTYSCAGLADLRKVGLGAERVHTCFSPSIENMSIS